MKEIILCKYGEIILKGANRATFEHLLVKELRYRSKFHGNFRIERAQSLIYIIPQNDDCDIDGMYKAASETFGIIAIGRAAAAPKNLDAICETAKSYLPQFLSDKKTFKVESKRADKNFEYKSPEISAEVGGAILSKCGWLKVDVKNPDVTVKVEVREDCAYIHAGQVHAAGGIPIGSSGNGLLLLSGGIDSPVSGYMMA